MTESSDYESVQVFIGVDVGKDTHHAVAINRSGKRLFDKALPNDENKLRSLISDLKQHGQILLVVDQPATIGALPVAVARSEGVLVGYLPGLAMRRIADLHAGEAKTDARDAAIIAEAARTSVMAIVACMRCSGMRGFGYQKRLYADLWWRNSLSSAVTVVAATAHIAEKSDRLRITLLPEILRRSNLIRNG